MRRAWPAACSSWVAGGESDPGRLYKRAKPDGLRELVLGARGEGTVTYLILERQREVHVVLVQWIG